MEKLRENIDLYRFIMMALVVVLSFLYLIFLYSILIFLGFCIPGFLNNSFNKPDNEGKRRFFVAGNVLFPYEVLKFVWDGFQLTR